MVAQDKKKRTRSPEHVRARVLKKYGMTSVDYEKMNARQNGMCAICGSPQRMQFRGKGYCTNSLHVDHDHVTNKVRGLLCDTCNVMLGLAHNNPDKLRLAAEYLEKSATITPRTGDWMQTMKGRKVYPLDPRPEDVDIEDIAHALSIICRFNGHVPRHYSVAEHSVYVMKHVIENGYPDLAMHALMHDAPEAYVGDIVRPLKRSSAAIASIYAEADRRWFLAFEAAFSMKFPMPMPLPIKEADNSVLMAERRDLLNKDNVWKESALPWSGKIEGWDHKKAKSEFLAAFRELKK